jgi:hypothetical protein
MEGGKQASKERGERREERGERDTSGLSERGSWSM